ncbi:unnamed protein product [Paramecium sonneborni]|uniref:Uncharacterized protein n=1 Tax=Paramecium sonneborni TaxID=65129 RepID=A0A8S1RAE0_9CILI|nr:unnamed protein product [Paramecium sonneborni]
MTLLSNIQKIKENQVPKYLERKNPQFKYQRLQRKIFKINKCFNSMLSSKKLSRIL